MSTPSIKIKPNKITMSHSPSFQLVTHTPLQIEVIDTLITLLHGKSGKTINSKKIGKLLMILYFLLALKSMVKMV